MSLNNLKQISIIGAGQMGAGIAQVLASYGFKATLFDNSEAAVDKAISGISTRLTKAVEKGSIDSAKKEQTLKNIHKAKELKELKSEDLIIEAIVENTEVKKELFQNLDSICKSDCIFASNTSSISITKLAAFTKRPEKFIGMHYMNPVPVMKLVEIIRGLQTSDETYNTIKELTLKIEKTPVTARKDFPGFIVNRILIPMINEACFALMEGIATPEEIDTAMKLGTNQPMGPLELADFVGLDTCLSICQIFQRELGDDKYRPCPLLIKYVEAGWLGRKTSRGFYKY